MWGPGSLNKVAVTRFNFKKLEQSIRQIMHDWRVPGLSIVVVKNDNLVFGRGYGFRELGKEAPVDCDTVFAIASVTKSFTAAAMGMLVDAELVSWDDPVIKHIPEFELSEPYITREATIRDLLSHKMGYEQADNCWGITGCEKSEILPRLKHLRQVSGFREQFTYSNLMYMLAGIIIERVTNSTWSDFLSRRIFSPLSMRSSSTSVTSLKSVKNLAKPHAHCEGKLVTIPFRNLDVTDAAGAINSSANDMANWLKLQINQGAFGRNEVISARSLLETQRAQTIIFNESHIVINETSGRLEERPSPFFSYGMGWVIFEYNGAKVLNHSGRIDGMSAMIGLLPGQQLGVAIMANSREGQARFLDAILLTVFDQFMDGISTDWNLIYRELRDNEMAVFLDTERKREEGRRKGTAPSLDLNLYEGSYQNCLYGPARVFRTESGLGWQIGKLESGDLEHFHDDTFLLKWHSPVLGSDLVHFVVTNDGKVSKLEIESLCDFDRTG